MSAQDLDEIRWIYRSVNSLLGILANPLVIYRRPTLFDIPLSRTETDVAECAHHVLSALRTNNSPACGQQPTFASTSPLSPKRPFRHALVALAQERRGPTNREMCGPGRAATLLFLCRLAAEGPQREMRRIYCEQFLQRERIGEVEKQIEIECRVWALRHCSHKALRFDGIREKAIAALASNTSRRGS